MNIGVLEHAAQQASSAQVRALETAHKKLFSYLVDAWDKYHTGRADLYLPNGQYNSASKYTPTRLNAYAQRLIPLTNKWRMRQAKFEAVPNSNTQITAVPISNQSFVTPAGFAVLKAARNQMNREQQTSGIGFIPLIIWAVIAIVAAFTAVEVTDEMNNTAEEQADLLVESNNFCTSQNLTPEQCLQVQQQAQEATETSAVGSAVKWGLLAVGGFFAVKYLAPEIKKRYGKKEAA